MVRKRVSLDFRDSGRPFRDMIVMDALAASNLREAFLALKIATDLVHSFPFELIILMLRVMLLPIVDFWLSMAEIQVITAIDLVLGMVLFPVVNFGFRVTKIVVLGVCLFVLSMVFFQLINLWLSVAEIQMVD